ncbi:hypothetical protein PC129_g21604, partial [Phytophthora cactorum]
ALQRAEQVGCRATARPLSVVRELHLDLSPAVYKVVSGRDPNVLTVRCRFVKPSHCKNMPNTAAPNAILEM